MAKTMRRVIELKVYATQQEVVDRLNSFMMWGQITPNEYNELMLLTENVYNPAVVEPTEETEEEFELV